MDLQFIGTLGEGDNMDAWLVNLGMIIEWCWDLLCYPIHLGSYTFSLKDAMFFALSLWIISNVVLTFMDADDIA